MKKIYEGKIHKSQAKIHLVKSIDNQQSSYNLSLNTMNDLIESNAVKLISNEQNNDVYELNDGWLLNLGKNILDLINLKHDNNFKIYFDHTKSSDGTEKFQIKRVRHKEENNLGNYIWFRKLYDSNYEDSIVRIYLDEQNKTLNFDIQLPDLNFDTLVLKEVFSTPIEPNVYYLEKFVDNSQQLIFYGAPGTGKSFKITQILNQTYKEESKEFSEFVDRITIHSEYSYFDFIGSILPIVRESKQGDSIIEYKFKEGAFTKALKKAINYPDMKVFLILEEMSRGNIASIFGDTFQLLDRKNGISEYGIKNDLISNAIFQVEDMLIRIPKNLAIIGSINTSDQNVFVMDTAFKRRFDFTYVSTDKIGNLNNYTFTFNGMEISWLDFYQKFNAYILNELQLSEDKQIGQFFIDFSRTYDFNRIADKLVNFIWNDVHKVSYSKSIISDTIKSFSVALDGFKNNKWIFNEDFLRYFE